MRISDWSSDVCSSDLFGLGIRHVGAITARDLLKAFGTVEAIADVATRAAAEPEARGEIEAVEGVGPVFAEALGAFFAEEHNRTAWDDPLSVTPPQTGIAAGRERGGEKVWI